VPQLRDETTVDAEGNSHSVIVNVGSLPKGRYHIGFYVLGGGRVDQKVFTI